MSASAALVAHYAATHPDALARRIERMPADDATAVLVTLGPAVAAGLLPYLAPGDAARLLIGLPPETAGAVIASMRTDLAAALLRRTEPAVASRILDRLPSDEARALGALLAHDPGTAGGVMDPHVLTVPAAATVADARGLIERSPAHLYYYVYLVDAEHRLDGVLDLAELTQADADHPLRAVARRHVTWLLADAPLASVFAHPGWRSFDALPVVDGQRRFLGALRHRRMRELLEQTVPASGEDRTIRVVMALGEVYWLGLCGLLQGIAATAAEPRSSGASS